MDAFELRIGNGFMINWSKEIRWADWMDIRDIAENRINGGVSPITLTEEWLLKFGFEQVYTGSITKRFDLIKDDRFSYTFSTIANFDFGFRFIGRFINVRYVHQLQNLYFALTGTELVLKSVGEKI